ncbi:hypothetical protein ACJW30_05G156400 [Castanea mollissima]
MCWMPGSVSSTSPSNFSYVINENNNNNNNNHHHHYLGRIHSLVGAIMGHAPLMGTLHVSPTPKLLRVLLNFGPDLSSSQGTGSDCTMTSFTQPLDFMFVHAVRILQNCLAKPN